MNKLKFYIALIFALVISVAAEYKNDCEVKLLKNELKKELKPGFKYDSSHLNQFKLSSEVQTKSMTVPLLSGERYQLLFNTAALPSNFTIQIFDKPKSAKKRKLLFEVKDSEELTQHIFSFEPEKPQTMYVNYILPDASKTNIYGCVVFLMGYKIV